MISIIIPVYNVKAYVRQCLDSVVSQTYEKLEIIVIDDGSTDGSGAICDEYAKQDKRVRVFHTSNKGLSAARNYGLDHISPETEYVAFLDSDDWMETHAIETLYEAASRQQADIVCCLYQNEFVDNSFPSASLKNEIVFDDEEVIRAFGRKDFITTITWDKLYKAKLFNSLRFPEGRVFEDVATIYKTMIAAERVVVIPDVLFHYRMRKNGICQSHTIASLIDRWNSNIERFDGVIAVTSDDASRQSLIASCIAVISVLWRWYYQSPKAERLAAKQTMDEMQSFIRKYSGEVLRDSRYTKLQKATCLFARSRNPLLLRLLNVATRLYRALTRDKMFE